jgi:hypothetical protein
MNYIIMMPFYIYSIKIFYINKKNLLIEQVLYFRNLILVYSADADIVDCIADAG